MKIIKFILLFFSLSCLAQKELKVRYKEYVKGDIYFAANSIVNRDVRNETPNIPYNIIDNNGLLNDEFIMHYIDIDNDNSTFSSSSAELNINIENYVVKFAGLYWSATYMYDEMEKKIKKDRYIYKIVKEERSDFETVKFKLPNSEKYVDVKGTTLFDGFNNSEYKMSSPYVVFADVTNLIASQKNASGYYTVANIKATQGHIEGGVSGGWSLFVVIEDINQTETKQITLLDGFISIFEQPNYFTINDFKTPEEGLIETQIAMASIEGDFNLKGDDVSLKTNLDERFYTLTNPAKQKGNFFNSSIINDNAETQNRIPNSLNNLGFDAMLIPYKNEFEKTIPNNSSEVTLKLSSKYDRTFLYFLGFSVNSLKTDLYASNTEKTSSEEKNSDITEDREISYYTVKTNNEPEPTQNETTLNTEKEDSQKKINPATTTYNLDIQYKNIPNTSTGYYVINSSSSNKIIAEIEKKALVTKGNKQAGFYFDETDKTYHVYSAIYKNSNDVYANSQNIIQNNYWVNAINIKQVENNTLTSNPKEVKTEKNTVVSIQKNTKTSTQNTSIVDEFLKKYKIENQDVTEIETGYYLVVNVYSKEKYCNLFLNKLKSEGLPAKVFFNSVNQFRYVYLFHTTNLESIVKLYDSKFDQKYIGDMWIKAVNITNEDLFVNIEKVIKANLLDTKNEEKDNFDNNNIKM